MILVDTDAWVYFFKGDERGKPVRDLILKNSAVLHPYVWGELLLGGVSKKTENLMLSLDMVPEADNHIVFDFIRERNIAGSGAGWVDVNILASALMHDCRVLTYDEGLRGLCKKFGCI